MLRRDHQHELVARDRRGDQIGVVDAALDEADLGEAVTNGAGDLAGVADRQVDADQRVAHAEGLEPARQPVAGDGLAGVQQQRAALQLAHLGQLQPGRRSPRQHGAGLVQEHAAGLGQLDATSDPGEQLDLAPVLERVDRVADGRLRQVERPRRLRHVLPLGHGDEHAELLQGHRTDYRASSVVKSRPSTSVMRSVVGPDVEVSPAAGSRVMVAAAPIGARMPYGPAPNLL